MSIITECVHDISMHTLHFIIRVGGIAGGVVGGLAGSAIASLATYAIAVLIAVLCCSSCEGRSEIEM